MSEFLKGSNLFDDDISVVDNYIKKFNEYNGGQTFKVSKEGYKISFTIYGLLRDFSKLSRLQIYDFHNNYNNSEGFTTRFKVNNSKMTELYLEEILSTGLDLIESKFINECESFDFSIISIRK